MSVVILPIDPQHRAVFFDVTTSETHTFTSELTENPVEDGSDVNDHVIHAPQEFSCDVQVSNTPIEQTRQLDMIDVPLIMDLPGYPIPLTLLPNTPPLPAEVMGFTFAKPVDRIKRTLEELLVLRDAAARLIVETTSRDYSDMILTSIERTVVHENVAVFTLSFRQITIVTTETVDAPQPKEPRGQPGAAKGPQTPPKVETPEEQRAKRKTLAASIVDQFGNLLTGGGFGG